MLADWLPSLLQMMPRATPRVCAGVASLTFNPASSPCLCVNGGLELSNGQALAICSLATLPRARGAPPAPERYVAATHDGSLAVLKPQTTTPNWRSPSTWRQKPTGGLSSDRSSRDDR